jgi:V/A-type H+-transporting ATPase subunit F
MEYFTIAQRELVLAFKLVGVDGQAALNRKEALDAFYRVTGHGGVNSMPVAERPKILILSEDVSDMLEKEVLEWQKTAQFPLIVEIPPVNGHLEGKKSLTQSIREAMGISI